MARSKLFALIGLAVVVLIIVLVLASPSTTPKPAAATSGLSTSTQDLIKESQQTAKFLEQQYIPQKTAAQ